MGVSQFSPEFKEAGYFKKPLSCAQTAEKAKIGRTTITAIVNGNIAKISTDKLIDVAA